MPIPTIVSGGVLTNDDLNAINSVISQVNAGTLGGSAPSTTLDYFPARVGPAATTGAPTIAQCQALVAAVAANVADKVIQNSAVLRYIFRSTKSGLSNGVVTTDVNGVSVSPANLTNVTEAVPVDVIAANSVLAESLAHRLGAKMGKIIDGLLLAQWGQFTNKGAVGTPSTKLTQTTIDQVITTLPTLGLPIILTLSMSDAIQLATDPALGTIPGGLWPQALFAGFLSAPDFPLSFTVPTEMMRISVTDQVAKTGSGPVTTHNLAYTPDALGFLSNVPTPTNDSTHAQAVSTAAGLSLLVSITNTGSGVQTVTVGGLGCGYMLTNAHGVQVLS